MKLTKQQIRTIVDAMVDGELTPEMHWVIGAGLAALSREMEREDREQEIISEHGTYLRKCLDDI